MQMCMQKYEMSDFVDKTKKKWEKNLEGQQSQEDSHIKSVLL